MKMFYTNQQFSMNHVQMSFQFVLDHFNFLRMVLVLPNGPDPSWTERRFELILEVWKKDILLL